MLKGLGEQLASMKYNIIDSAQSVLIVLFSRAENGRRRVRFVRVYNGNSEFLTQHRKASQSDGARFKVVEYAALPALAAVGACALTSLILKPISLSPPVFLALGVFALIAFYILLSRLFGALTSDDAAWARSVVSRSPRER
jgi:hypothetical protein